MRRLRCLAQLAMGLLLVAVTGAGAGVQAAPPPRKAPRPAISQEAPRPAILPRKGRVVRPPLQESAALLPRADPETLEDEAAIEAAIPAQERILAEREKALAPDDPSVADALLTLGILYRQKRAYDRAEPLIVRALEIREKALGPDHLDVAEALFHFAILRRKKRVYEGAEQAFLRALKIREKRKGAEDPAVADVLNELGLLYRRQLAYDRAALIFQRAIRIREEALGPEHLDVAVSMNHLAMLYWSLGEYTRSEPLLLQALAIREKALGQEHPDVAQSLKNLAVVYRDEGQYDRAEALFLRSITILEGALGPDHRDVAHPLYNLAGVYRKQGRLEQADALLQRALAISEKALGPEHPDVAQSLMDLGSLYSQQGDYAHAERLLERALAIFEKALGPNHPDVAHALNNLALVYLWKDERARAEPLLLRALSIQEKSTGPESADVAPTLSILSSFYLAEGRVPEAVRMRSRGAAIRERMDELILDAGSEDRKLAYLATLEKDTDATVSLHAFSAPSDPSATRLALTTVLRRKGRILDVVTDSLSVLRRHLTPEVGGLFDRRSKVVTDLAKVASHVDEGAPEDAQLAQIKRLDDERQQLEAEISRRSAEFRAERRAVSIEEVQAAIPEGKALLEIFRYLPFEPRSDRGMDHWGAPRYVLYRLLHEGAPEGIDLGEAAPIDGMVDRLREALSDPGRDPQKAARALDQAVMRPARRLLGKVRDVWVSPDGALNLIPFYALIDEDGRYLIDRYCFTYLTSGRDLIRLEASASPREGPVVMANPAFGPLSAASALARDRGALGGVLFPPLVGTAREASAIGKRLEGARVFTGEAASETQLKALHGPRIVHIATHGFFLPGPTAGEGSAPRDEGAMRGARPRVAGTRSGGEKGGSAALMDNPLLRAGLAFAGANEHRAGADDGVLTALEAAALDLYGTKLIVLSACETGIGDVKRIHGDGVYGLRRALVMAGAETQVMSMWKVDDEATRQLMGAYYAQLEAGVGRSQAMRAVEQVIRRSSPKMHPYYWASFIVSGASTPLVAAAPGVAGVAPGARGFCTCSEVGGWSGSGSGGWGGGGGGVAVGVMAVGVMAAGRRRDARRRKGEEEEKAG